MSNQKKDISQHNKDGRTSRLLMSPREAWFAQSVNIPSTEIIGRVAGEFVTPYPPGIPVICPGEEITAEKAAIIQSITAKIKVIK